MKTLLKLFLIIGLYFLALAGFVAMLSGLSQGNASRKFRPLAEINATDIEYIDQPDFSRLNACRFENCDFEKGHLWTMVFIVKSKAENFKHREFIRRTWGAVGYIEGGRLITIFCVGQSNNDATNNLLLEEKERYHDLLHYAGPDDYTNIAFKTLTGMRWASDNLPDHYLYSTGDDDFLVDLGIMSETVANGTRLAATDFNGTFPIICTFDWRDQAKPFRTKISKWFVSKEEYPFEVYPKFCLGGMYAATVDLVRRLWNESQYSTPMRVDDVWITGLLRERLRFSKKLMIMPSPPAAFHMWGFAGGKKTESTREFMKKDWEKVYNNFRNKSLCYCRR